MSDPDPAAARILVMGAGGVGGYYGALLLDRGHAVTLVARGAHLDALRERGLELRTESGTRLLRPVRAVASPPSTEDAFDIVLFTVKGYDTEAAARTLAPALGPETTILTLQNGVESVERLAAVLGPGRLLAGTTVIEATIAAPGVVAQTGPRPRIVLGEPSGAVTPRVERLAAVLRGAGVDVAVTTDARRAVWEKFLRLAPGASLTSVCGMSIGEIRATPDGIGLYRAMVAEVAAVGRACGVGLAPDVVETVLDAIKALPPAMKTSMQRDFERGRQLEIEELTGTVVRLGARSGVPTPTFAIVYALLQVRVHGRPPGDSA